MLNRIEFLAWLGQRIGKPPGWERVVRRFAGPERFRGWPDVCLVRDGMAFIAQPAVPLSWNIALFGSYEPELRSILSALLQPGGVAVDVGANVGWHTLLMAKKVGPTGKVLAIEANPSVGQRLAENVVINCLTQVEIIPCALADKPGILQFFGPANGDAESGNGFVMPSENVPSSVKDVITVKARTLDSVVVDADVKHVNVIKIDIEGYEWPVLQGATATIKKFRPHIIFEYVTEYAPRGGGMPADFIHFFERHGYRLYAIGRNWNRQITLATWPKCSDIWAMPMPREAIGVAS